MLLLGRRGIGDGRMATVERRGAMPGAWELEGGQEAHGVELRNCKRGNISDLRLKNGRSK